MLDDRLSTQAPCLSGCDLMPAVEDYHRDASSSLEPNCTAGTLSSQTESYIKDLSMPSAVPQPTYTRKGTSSSDLEAWPPIEQNDPNNPKLPSFDYYANASMFYGTIGSSVSFPPGAAPETTFTDGIDMEGSEIPRNCLREKSISIYHDGMRPKPKSCGPC